MSVAQFHLESAVQVNREALLEQLVDYQRLARAIERQRDHIPAERLIVLRSSLDCWEPVGQFAILLLSAAKDAVSSLLLIELYPLIDLWEVHAPDAWALLDSGRELLASINLQPEPGFDDYAIQPDERVIARYTWQRANNIARHVGARRLSEN